MDLNKAVKLILESGEEFKGYSFGAESSTSGEVVFNTGMVGYPESLTDPSYKGQILVLTYPLIGNYGVPGNEKENDLLKNFESDKIQVQALIVSDYSFQHSHWNTKKSLSDWLKEENIPGIYGIDTRKLTKIIRDKGVMLGKIIFDGKNIEFYDPNSINIVKEGMREAVVRGSSMYLSSLPYEVAGKTGTAQTSNTYNNAWFSGFGPYNDPEIVVTVLLEAGETSDRAVRVAHDIFGVYFENIK